MRLLLVAERHPPDIGGLARSGARTAATLARMGHEVEVLAFTKTLPPGSLDTSETDEAVTVHRFGLFAHLDLSFQHCLNLVEYLHRQKPYDAFWGHYLFPAGYLAVVLAELCERPSTVSARGNDVDRLMFPPGDFARLRWTLERATSVTAVSAELVRKIELLARRQATPIPNAVDLDRYRRAPVDAETRASLGVAPDEVVLGFCGELRHKKGFPFLLDTLVAVRRHQSACLLVVGEVRHKAVPHLQAFAAEHPAAAERILVTGRMDDQDEVARAYNACDLYLQPSVWEGLPNALLEAMACERVCLASDAGGIPEAIVHGKSGFCIPKTQLHRFGEAAIELLALPAAERAAIGEAARARVADRFTAVHEEAALAAVLAPLVP